MQLPAFLKKVNEKLLYDGNNELVYYIPNAYFQNTKSTVARVEGAYVHSIGVFDWALVNANGSIKDFHIFRFPTMITCKPHSIEVVKDFSINGTTPTTYRVLHFKNGDEAISDINIPEDVENVEALFRMMILVDKKMPPTIPYDKLHEYFPENIGLNGLSYGLNMQMFGIMVSELCRDSSDISKPARLSKKIDKNMTDYRQISIKQTPKFVSPYTALTSENWDESLMSAIQMSAEGNETKTPLERVVTG